MRLLPVLAAARRKRVDAVVRVLKLGLRSMGNESSVEFVEAYTGHRRASMTRCDARCEEVAHVDDVLRTKKGAHVTPYSQRVFVYLKLIDNYMMKKEETFYGAGSVSMLWGRWSGASYRSRTYFPVLLRTVATRVSARFTCLFRAFAPYDLLFTPRLPVR